MVARAATCAALAQRVKNHCVTTALLVLQELSVHLVFVLLMVFVVLCHVLAVDNVLHRVVRVVIRCVRHLAVVLLRLLPVARRLRAPTSTKASLLAMRASTLLDRRRAACVRTVRRLVRQRPTISSVRRQCRRQQRRLRLAAARARVAMWASVLPTRRTPTRRFKTFALPTTRPCVKRIVCVRRRLARVCSPTAKRALA